jgi:hypothetical protein
MSILANILSIVLFARIMMRPCLPQRRDQTYITIHPEILIVSKDQVKSKSVKIVQVVVFLVVVVNTFSDTLVEYIVELIYIGLTS